MRISSVYVDIRICYIPNDAVRPQGKPPKGRIDRIYALCAHGHLVRHCETQFKVVQESILSVKHIHEALNPL
jgi:hypothetical protein